MGAALVLFEQKLGQLAEVFVVLDGQASALAANAQLGRRRQRPQSCCWPPSIFVHVHGG